MDKTQYDELFEILDNFGGGIEDFIEQLDDPDSVQMVLSSLQQKLDDLVFELQNDIEKMDLTELAV